MKSMLKITMVACIMLGPFACRAGAEDVNAMMDGFYNGLAVIIERNMEAPDVCVAEVNAYYDDNRAAIRRIREISAQCVEEMGPAMNEYASMTGEELKALDEKMKGRRFDHETSAGANRYTEAMKSFAMRYPQQGMRIATKAFQLVPGTALE